MNIQTSLMAWYDFEENFDLGYDIHDSSGRGNHVPVAGSFIEIISGTSWIRNGALRMTGINGYGISPKGNCSHLDTANPGGTIVYQDFRLASGSFTIAAWHFMPLTYPVFYSSEIVGKQQEYLLRITGTGTVSFERYFTGVNSDELTIAGLATNAWHFIVAWYDAALGTLNLHVNNALVDVMVTTVNGYYSTLPFTIGPSPAGWPYSAGCIIDSVGIWKRALTQAERIWLYNHGAGRSWSDIVPPVSDVECKEIECCDPVSMYVSKNATDSGAGINMDTECEEDAIVEFSPPCGSMVVFPIYVHLKSNYATATIRYTTDGSDPDETSTIYTGPIEVVSPSTHIRAIAYPQNCDEGEIFDCSWEPWDSLMLFQVYCDTFTDTVGSWDVWVPNLNNDIYWWLEIIAGGNIVVDRFEIYQLDTLLEWTTGAAWATNSPITPPPPWDQSKTFPVYPLMFNEVGVGVIHNSYVDNFGTITAGVHQYVLTGEPITALGGIFQLIIYLDSGLKVYAYARYSSCDVCPTPPCGGEPPPCPYPILTSLTPGCKEITIDFEVTAPDRNWKIYMSESDTGEDYVQVASGTGSGALQETIAGLANGTEYFFYISQELTEAIYDHCEDWTDSTVDSITTQEASEVSISASAVLVDSGNTITISVDSDHIPVGGTVTVTSVPALAGTPWSVTPNASNQTKDFDIVVDTIFTVTVAGGCENPTDSVTVKIRVPATCDTAWVALHTTLLVYHDDARPPFNMWAVCNAKDDYLNTCAPPSGSEVSMPEWDGKLLARSVGDCVILPCCCYNTSLPGTDIYQYKIDFAKIGVELCLEEASNYGGPPGDYWWVMTCSCLRWADQTYSLSLWVGYKADGTTPEGTYYRMATETMCDTTTNYVKVIAI